MIQEKTQKLKEIYENFQSNLESFAKANKTKINKDAESREKFNQLCAKLGVNPVLSRKGLFSDFGFGNFYNELAVVFS